MNSMYEYTPPTDGGSSERVERVTFEDGALLHVSGHPHPIRGYPTEGAVRAVCISKKLARSLLTPLPLLTLRTTYRRFMEVSHYTIHPYILHPHYMQPSTRELRRVLENSIGQDAAAVISHLFEYDSAYRVRFQDMLSFVPYDVLYNRPWYALSLMNKRNYDYDYPGVHKKIRPLLLLAAIVLLYPPYLRAFRKALEYSHYPSLLPTTIDHYWMSLRTDYGPTNQNRPAALGL